MKKILLTLALIATLFTPLISYAQSQQETETFRAEVTTIFDTRTFTRDNGTEVTQQDIMLYGLSGTWKNKDFRYYGISDIDVLSMTNTIYKPGDKVVVNWYQDINGEDQFFIMNRVRRGHLYLLGLIFAIAIIVVGRAKGLRALISLIVSFIIITKFIIPQIIAGNNPLLIAIAGSILILGLIVYLTEGVNKKTHIAIVSIIISLLITFALSYIFVGLTHLTGFSSDEAALLAGRSGVSIVDFRGLLLAAILIGTLGVLDDVILGQIEAVNQIKKLNPTISKKQTIKSANEIGRTHLSSMVNTLFLTYAGASLPLLILFSVNPESAVTLGSALDNEAIATEVVRTLSGSIGLIMAFPITTYLATYFLKTK